MKYSKKFKKSFNGFNPLFSASEYLKIKGNSCLNEDENLRVGISNDFDFMDSEEFQNITNELKIEFKSQLTTEFWPSSGGRCQQPCPGAPRVCGGGR